MYVGNSRVWYIQVMQDFCVNSMVPLGTDIILMMENQMEKKMYNYMEAGFL